jgi:hypothetical protein
MSGVEKLTEIVEAEGLKIVPLHWEDGSTSYGIYENNGENPVIHVKKSLKDKIKELVPCFSHFGMGDVVHLK